MMAITVSRGMLGGFWTGFDTVYSGGIEHLRTICTNMLISPEVCQKDTCLYYSDLLGALSVCVISTDPKIS